MKSLSLSLHLKFVFLRLNADSASLCLCVGSTRSSYMFLLALTQDQMKRASVLVLWCYNCLDCFWAFWLVNKMPCSFGCSVFGLAAGKALEILWALCVYTFQSAALIVWHRDGTICVFHLRVKVSKLFLYLCVFLWYPGRMGVWGSVNDVSSGSAVAWWRCEVYCERSPGLAVPLSKRRAFLWRIRPNRTRSLSVKFICFHPWCLSRFTLDF